jgi:hypothetical protein
MLPGVSVLALLLGLACGPAATSLPLDPDNGSPGAKPVAAEYPAERPPTTVDHEATDSTPDEIGPAATPTRAPRPTTDPAGEDESRIQRYQNQGWQTDFSRHSVPFSEIFSGGPPRDGIPPLDDPTFVAVPAADTWLGTREPVILFEHKGDARAYPLQIMTWHEIVNDEVGGIPVTVTFCPLCNSAITFDRRLNGVVYDFGASGSLRNSDLVMWDRQTESWWQQFTGEAIIGELTGEKLSLLASTIVAWDDFKTFHPDGRVLSRDTGFNRDYGQNPYAGYDQVDLPPFLYRGKSDARLLPKERVAAVTIDEVDAAFPFSTLEQEKVVNYTVGGRPLVVFFKPGTQSALDDQRIDQSKEVGATAVFDAQVGGRMLTFTLEGDQFVDIETGSVWNLLGSAVNGPLSGATLTPIVHANHFWFAWAAFKPDTLIYPGRGK